MEEQQDGDETERRAEETLICIVCHQLEGTAFCPSPFSPSRLSTSSSLFMC